MTNLLKSPLWWAVAGGATAALLYWTRQTKVQPIPLSEDPVEEASMESFPASDPPSSGQIA